MFVTTFKSKSNKTKIPIPMNEKKEFEFITKQYNSLECIFDAMSKDYILSKPLNTLETVISPRRIEELKPFKSENLDYLVLDIDNIKTKKDYNDIIKFFKSQKYNILLGKSRSWNGIDVFNIKGLPENLRNQRSISLIY